MKAFTLSLVIFINLVIFGILSYMYLLWNQYWNYLDKQSDSTIRSVYDQQIYVYNRKNNIKQENTDNLIRKKRSIKHLKTNEIIFVKNGMPKFPNYRLKSFELDTTEYSCSVNSSLDSYNTCQNKTLDFKNNLIREMKRVFQAESKTLGITTDNRYNVSYKGVRRNFLDRFPKDILCDLAKVKMGVLKRIDIKGISVPLKKSLPKRALFENRHFNSCAIVASSGALKGSNLGKLIDSHNLVLRFNNAPTEGYEQDVGRKTTIRLLNSQVVSKPQFNFISSNLYKNITLVVWDPGNYSSSISEWLVKPDFDLFPNFVQFRRQEKKPKMYLMNPRSVWALWDFLQSNSPTRLRQNPPSSGFLGVRILLPVCNFIDIFEYVPSTRVSKRCHYYESEENPACTFGIWHPLAAEKLLTYHINSASDIDVFQKGFVRIKGFKDLTCPDGISD